MHYIYCLVWTSAVNSYQRILSVLVPHSLNSAAFIRHNMSVVYRHYHVTGPSQSNPVVVISGQTTWDINHVLNPTVMATPVPPQYPPTQVTVTLPPGWQQAQDTQGQTYYYNSVTNESSWTLPGQPNSSAPDSSALGAHATTEDNRVLHKL